MMDVHEPAVRSYNMSQIKGKNTKPEIIVRKHLHSKGFRFRLHDKTLPGKPDIILKKHRTVIFIHGCFWHGHEGCDFFVIPKTRTDWWLDKINKTKERDKKSTKAISDQGWRVITVWECELKKDKLDDTLERIVKALRG